MDEGVIPTDEGGLYRNLRQCPVHIKCSCYKSMVCTIVEFAAPVWDPYTLSNIYKLESIQRMVARFCYNDFSSVTDMLSSLNCRTEELKPNY